MIIDCLLPDMTGLEVLQQLRSTRNCDAPVVLITIVAERGAVAGFAIHDVLAKPLVETDLVASLARAGRSSPYRRQCRSGMSAGSLYQYHVHGSRS